jgi:hypothetical protein
VALKDVPETREILEQAIDIRLGLRTSLFVLGDIRRGLDYLREAEDLGPAGRRSPAPRARARLYRGRHVDEGVSPGGASVRPELAGHCEQARRPPADGDGEFLPRLGKPHPGRPSKRRILPQANHGLAGGPRERALRHGGLPRRHGSWMADVGARGPRRVRGRNQARQRRAPDARDLRSTVQPGAYAQRPRLSLLLPRRCRSCRSGARAFSARSS